MDWLQIAVAVALLGQLAWGVSATYRIGKISSLLRASEKGDEDAKKQLKILSGPRPSLRDALRRLSEPPKED